MTDTTTTTNNEHPQDYQYDIVLYGATSFVGKLTAEYLQNFISKADAEQAENQPIRWAIAGRSEQKLQELKQELANDLLNDDLPIIIANSDDSSSLDAMTSQTKVIISTVGPYLKYGEALIKSCVQNGTDYVDLTGEAIFIKDMMDKYKETAKKSGARIVNACGFDSIPSDLGVLFTQKYATEIAGEPCHTINMRVKGAKGGISGGTLASMATIFEEVGNDKARKKQLSNPYLLNDDPTPPKVRQRNNSKPKWDAENQRWLAPFVMASINTRIVHRTNQLTGYQYGKDFKYDEAMWTAGNRKGQLMSYAITAGLAGFATGMIFKPTRRLLNERVLPKSGSGPSKHDRDNGFFDIRFFGYTSNGHQVQTKVTGDKDPGYGSTCQMLAQCALCLVQDISKEEVAGGFWTPASAMAEPLFERLQAHAGIEFVRLQDK